MVIRSKNRVYYFDRHISDAVLRLVVVAVTFFFGLSSWLFLARTNKTIDAILWPRLQEELASLAGKEVTKLGTSEKSIFTRAMEEMEKDRAGITDFPDYADRISPNNQAVDMIRLRIRDLGIVMRAIGLFCLALFLFGFLVLRVIYGSSNRRWKILQWLYGAFNKDGAGRQPYGYVHSFSPVQRKVFEMAFAASKGNPDGRFDLDLERLCRQMFPGEDIITEKRRSLIAAAFTELCEEYFYFLIPGSRNTVIKTYCPVLPHEDKVRRESVRDLSGREIEVFTAGTFRFSPPLYSEYLKSRYPKLPHQVIYSLDDRKHPFAFRIYLTLWEALYDMRMQSDKEIQTHTISLSLFLLLDRACLEMSYEKDVSLLEVFHCDLSTLKEQGFIRGWYVEEHGEKAHQQWYKGVELFSYDSNINTYRLNTGLLQNKVYFFEMTPYAELDKIKILRRRCAYIDSLNTPCSRPALPGSPYCKRHARAMDFENPRLFYDKVKALPEPIEDNSPTPREQSQPENSPTGENASQTPESKPDATPESKCEATPESKCEATSESKPEAGGDPRANESPAEIVDPAPDLQSVKSPATPPKRD